MTTAVAEMAEVYRVHVGEIERIFEATGSASPHGCFPASASTSRPAAPDLAAPAEISRGVGSKDAHSSSHRRRPVSIVDRSLGLLGAIG